jgi:hypothetical protein
MERQGYALSLDKIHGDKWRASFYANPLLSAAGFAVRRRRGRRCSGRRGWR